MTSRFFSRSLLYPLLGIGLGSMIGAAVLLLRRLDGDPVSLAITCAVMAAGLFAVLGRVLGRKEDELRETAACDPLTGLANRRHFERRLSRDLREALATRRALTLLVIDLDDFKRLNDVGGHAVGDEALKIFAECLRRSCRSHDLPARYGGDEFVVLLPWTSAAEAMNVAARIRATLAEVSSGFTVSIGVADLARSPSARPESLFAAADRALYLAKARGKDQVVVASTATAITLPIAVRQSPPVSTDTPEPRRSRRLARLDRPRRRSVSP